MGAKKNWLLVVFTKNLLSLCQKKKSNNDSKTDQ